MACGSSPLIGSLMPVRMSFAAPRKPVSPETDPRKFSHIRQVRAGGLGERAGVELQVAVLIEGETKLRERSTLPDVPV